MDTSNLNTLIDKLPGYVQTERFVSLVDWQVSSYYNNDSFFSVILFDFSIKEDKKFVIKNDSIIKFFSTAINTIITNHTDAYTIDDDKFVIILADKTSSFARVIMKKIIDYVQQKYSDDLIISAGIAECPDDATSYSELYKIAHSRESIVSTGSSSVQQAVNWSGEINKSLSNIENNLKSSLFKEVSSLTGIINNYDKYLGEHSALVTQGCIILAQEIGLPWKEIEKLSIAALLHDIGYTAIPKEVYARRGRLSQDEWKIVKMHPIIACEHILKAMPMFDEYIPLILNHHEFLDGSGYPYGKKGDQIPLGSQILSIIDTYHAMRNDRPHRKAIPFEDIVDYFIKNVGIKWSEDLITIFAAILADNETSEKLDKSEEFSISLLINQ